MSQTPPKSTIVVIGAGIIGLTSALKIQQLLSERDSSCTTDVLLVAREWPTSIPGAPIQHSADYASMWAGAHVRPIPGSTPQLRREAKWLKQTMVEFERHLESDPSAGISQVAGVEYLGTSPPEYEEQDAETFTRESGLLGYRKYPASELPEGIRFGFEYQTYCINSPLYCGNLLRKFILHGGRTLQRDIKSPWEPYSWGSHIKAVINASGVGFGDPKCYPIRGHILLTNLSSAVKTITAQNSDGSWSFVIPRGFNGGTVIGGTKEINDWSLEPSLDTRRRILEAAKRIIPESCNQPVGVESAELANIQVIADIVGRRPARDGGMRVETETRDSAVGSQHVVHAYGAGGRGYELSWGIANEVQQLVREVLSPVTTRSKL
ncbi:FAD dependent oxidoreductase [Ilyonectria robusta]|uniref:FAD dependent oxidoreductase n=1 Tax=Ilyonectria robusta TaxID=1079257 RepID=UPI001E8D694A|nr:FAD dependent oxidoreductase [Ilyonectria robusta]KAH8729827.1 FAD dependent oxidoreductase [Ilyonectria robusta]